MGIRLERFRPDMLHDFSRRLLVAMKVPDDEARIYSDALLHGSLHGHPGQGQGFGKMSRIRREIDSGAYRPGAPVDVLAASPGWALWEGNNGLGPVVAARAMDQAIAFAGEHGVGQVWVRGSNHLSSCGFHALRAAAAGIIGICMTNAGPELAPWGGVTPVLGTNPWSIAVPSPGSFPLMLDIALTQSGKGMVRWHQREGLPIPANWAYAPDGSETDDPELALQGPLVPIGEYKGVGLSFMTDVLCGVLTGAGFGTDTYADPKRRNVGHFVMAVDPDRFVGAEAFGERLAAFCRQVKASERKAGTTEIYVPGELDYRRAEKRRRDGIEIEADTVAALRELAAELNVDCPL
ncbi:MAG: Ldh family oxidoreductase [Thermaerobacterales bacterium]